MSLPELRNKCKEIECIIFNEKKRFEDSLNEQRKQFEIELEQKYSKSLNEYKNLILNLTFAKKAKQGKNLFMKKSDYLKLKNGFLLTPPELKFTVEDAAIHFCMESKTPVKYISTEDELMPNEKDLVYWNTDCNFSDCYRGQFFTREYYDGWYCPKYYQEKLRLKFYDYLKKKIN